MLAVFVVVALLSTMVFRDGATSDADGMEQQKLARACMQWHLAAGAVVSRLVQSTRDADLVQVNDSVFRMRRARRNCEAGWVTLACQDYHAVAARMPGYAMTNQLFPCSRVARSPTSGTEVCPDIRSAPFQRPIGSSTPNRLNFNDKK